MCSFCLVGFALKVGIEVDGEGRWRDGRIGGVRVE